MMADGPVDYATGKATSDLGEDDRTTRTNSLNNPDEAVWDEFVKRYVRHIVAKTGRSPDDRMAERSLTIPYYDLLRFDVKLAEKLHQDPRKYLPQIEDAIRRNSIDIMAVRNATVRVRIVENAHQSIREARRPDRKDEMITIRGTVTHASEMRFWTPNMTFVCVRCANPVMIPQDRHDELRTPSFCDNCEKTRLFSKLEDTPRSLRNGLMPDNIRTFQQLQVIERTDDCIGGREPDTMVIELLDEMTDKIEVGMDITVTGILCDVEIRGRNGKNTATSEPYIEVIGYTIDNDRSKQAILTEKDLVMLKALSQEPDIVNRLAEALVPNVFGYPVEKEAIIISWAGGQQVGDGRRSRINILFVGDPGISKSQMLRTAAGRIPRAQYTSGETSTGKGLTAASDEITFAGRKTAVVKAGNLVLAHKSVCVVDEFDKLSKEDRDGLHTAIDSGFIPYNKRGLHAKLLCDTTVIGGCNPKYGEFDTNLSFVEQIDIKPSLLDRFDLIFVMARCNRTNVQADFITENIQNLRRKNTIKKEATGLIDQDTLVKYMEYSRGFNPSFDLSTDQGKKADELLISLYKTMRDGNGGVKVSDRIHESFCRISEAYAKLRFSETVSVEDVQHAYDLLMYSLRKTCTDNSTGKIDTIDLSMSPYQTRIRKIKEYMLNHDKTPEGVPVRELIDQLIYDNVAQSTAYATIGKMVKTGDMMYVDSNKKFLKFCR